MKHKTLAAIIIAATCITLVSCYWLFGKKASAEKNKSIVGKWTIVNITDSSKKERNAIGILALALASKDSIPITVEFNADSTFNVYQSKQSLQDSGKFYLDSTAQILLVKQDSSSSAFNIRQWTDSSLQLFSAPDSLSYILRRQ